MLLVRADMAVYIGAVLWLLVFSTNFRHIISADIVVKATCADSMTLYADGNEIDRHNTKTTAKTMTIPEETKVVAIECTTNPTTSVTAGILASFKMEYEGDYVTDTTWRCNNKKINDWTKANFDDTQWLYASTSGDNDQSQAAGLSKVSGIADHAKWIWTSSYVTQVGDPQVYCRGHIQIKRSYTSFGRKFAIGFIDNQHSRKGIKLLMSTLKPTGVTVFCFTPHKSTLSEVITVTAGEIKSIKPDVSLRNDGQVEDGDKAIICVATDAVKMVGENQEENSSDLFLCIPIDAIGTKTDSVEYYAVSWDHSDDGIDGRILLVTAFDNTVIDITATADIKYGGVTQNSMFQVTLQKYRILQIDGAGKDLTGTYIQGNKPFSAFSGNKKTQVRGADANAGSRDHLVEQLAPKNTFGTNFVITPLPYRDSSISSTSKYRVKMHLAWYKFIAGYDSTAITVKLSDGTTISRNIAKAGGFYKYQHKEGQSAYVESNKEIMLVQFATTKSSGECTGDPWMQLIPPVFQFDNDYMISPPILTKHTSSSCLNTNKDFFTIIVKNENKSAILVNGKQIGTPATDFVFYGYKDIPGSGYSYQTVETPPGPETTRVQSTSTAVTFGIYYFGYGKLDSYASAGGTRMAISKSQCVQTQASSPGDGIDNNCDGVIDNINCINTVDDCKAPQPINGNWSAWTLKVDICKCAPGSDSKDRGSRQYTRACDNPVPQNNGWGCSGDSSEERANDCPCVPVNGVWSDWFEYGRCSTTCGPGQKTRIRLCNNPPPANGGNDCGSDNSQTTACNVTPCPINGVWSEYTNTTSCVCSQGTYSGKITQNRECNNPEPQHGGANCTGDTTKQIDCNCPRDGQWSVWGSYSTCSTTCGLGDKSRSRTCNNPAPAYGGESCNGTTTDQTTCNVTGCPVDGAWSTWTGGSTCVCYQGVQGRKEYARTCTDPAPAHSGAQCSTTPTGSSKYEDCSTCVNELQGISDYTVQKNQTITCSCTKTEEDKTLQECLDSCSANQDCDALEYISTNVTNKCITYNDLGDLTSISTSNVFQKNSAVEASSFDKQLADEADEQAERAANAAEPLGGNSMMIAAIGGAVGAAVIGATCTILFVKRRRKKKKEEEEELRKKCVSRQEDDMALEDLSG